MIATRPALLAEFLGTAILLIAIVGSGIASSAAGSPSAQLFQHAVIVGLALIALVAALAPVSGAHLNPAVTVADAALGNRPWATVGPYVGVQVAGGATGVLLTNLMFGRDAVSSSQNLRAGLGLVTSEGLATFVLVLVIFLVVAGRFGQHLPMVVGVTVTSLIFATPSTALMNPAVTLARTLTDSWTGVRLVDAGPYVVAQIGGALLAVAVARTLERGSQG